MHINCVKCNFFSPNTFMSQRSVALLHPRQTRTRTTHTDNTHIQYQSPPIAAPLSPALPPPLLPLPRVYLFAVDWARLVWSSRALSAQFHTKNAIKCDAFIILAYICEIGMGTWLKSIKLNRLVPAITYPTPSAFFPPVVILHCNPYRKSWNFELKFGMSFVKCIINNSIVFYGVEVKVTLKDCLIY